MGATYPPNKYPLEKVTVGVRSEPMTDAVTPGRELEPCPFCGKPLDVKRGRINPAARCITEGCYGTRMSVVNLDDPEWVRAWNTRLAANPSSDPDAMNEKRAVQDARLVANVRAATLAEIGRSGDEGVREWRCFHCGEVFTDADAAKEHFGPDPNCGGMLVYEPCDRTWSAPAQHYWRCDGLTHERADDDLVACPYDVWGPMIPRSRAALENSRG